MEVSTHHPSSEREFSRGDALAAGAIGIVLTAVVVAVPLHHHQAPHPALTAALNGITVAVLVSVGFFAWRRDQGSNLGPLLVFGALLSVLVAFSTSSDDTAYSTGRVAIWLREGLLLYLFLLFPTGRLQGKPERAIVFGAAATLLLFYVPSALLDSTFPASPISCVQACPDNAFQLLHPEPGFVDSLLVPMRSAVTAALFIATAVVILRRLLAATALARRGLMPVLSLAVLRALTLVGLEAAQAFGWNGLVAPLEAALFVSIPIAALAFLVGLFRWRQFSLLALRELAIDRDEPELHDLQRRLALALNDPSLELLRAAPGAPGKWRNQAGNPATLPSPSERCVVRVDDEGVTLAAIACDYALREQHELLDAASAWVRTILVRRRLMHDVEASRRRIATAAATERRRIERDLHDGAQQQLVTLRVRLELLSEQIERDPEHGAELLRELGPRVDSVIEEVRHLASGIYPSLLADAGLVEALRAAALRSAVPTTVRADGIHRNPSEIETAVYFCCLEALQNASKHGQASAIWVKLESGDGVLRFEVRDDGIGFDAEEVPPGTGLTNMQDRIAALGGEMAVESEAGHGTVVSGRVPVVEVGAPAIG